MITPYGDDEPLRINGILELIDGIAFRTNILSLNASVERTRQGAGEIEQLRTLVDDLSLMSEQQRASISQMNGSIASIDASVQENVQHVAQTIQLAQQQQQTDALKAAISVFRFG